jgi:dihydrofolate synthase/folylpolyglutamate synthase
MIAQEKSGIIKPNQVAIAAPQQEAVLAMLRQACEAQGVPLFYAGQDFTVGVQSHDLEGLQMSITAMRGIYDSLSLPLLGLHQAHNAAVAVAALEALSTTGMPYSIIESGLARVEWPGRLEVVNDVPLVLMDGAHNPQAAAALKETLIELCHNRRIHFLVGLSADKAVEPIAQRLAEVAFGMTCTRSRHPRAMDPTDLAKRLIPYCSNVHVMSDAADACTYLLNAVSSEDVIVITGSLFLVGELRAAFRRFQTSRRTTALASA